MGKILKNLVPYYKSVIVILLFLVIQAWCDLALPQYTSDIIDVGIQNSGVKYAMPEKITQEEFDIAEKFMTDEEKRMWEDSYIQNGKLYEINIKENKIKSRSSELSMALLMNFSMSNVKEKEFKKRMASQMQADEKDLEKMSVEEIGKMLGITFKVTETDGEKYVDMREMMSMMPKEAISTMRESMEKKMDVMGKTMISSMGIAYAVKCDKEAGVNIDEIQKDYLWTAGLKMLAFALIMGVATVVVGFFSARIGAGIGRDLRSKIFTKVVGFSNAEMDKFSTASLITRSTNDVQQIQMVTTMLLRMVAYAPILGIGGIIKVAGTKSGMGWVIAVAVITILIYIGTLVVLSMPRFKKMQILVDKVNLIAREILTGLSVIRAFGREDKEEERFDEANKELTGTMLFVNRVMTFMMPGMMFIMYGVSVLIIWVAAHRIDGGHMQVGTMTAFITYSMMIVMSFLMMTVMSIILPRAGVAAERIDEVIHTEVTVKDSDNPTEIKQNKGIVEFENVSFKYPGAKENVLNNISFKAQPGKTTAIIGSTGCGKSTLVNLIVRLYDVTEGKIKVDGVDIRDLKLIELRDNIGYVPQKAVLFSGTIEENLKFGNENATETEVKSAAEIAQAADFIEDKEEKYKSHIAQGGSNVSGGQKQRLSIARAIAKNPKVYIFDDSFSALDMKTDAALRKALEPKVKDSAVIIVAQRISTILNADEIIVLDEGEVAGKGTHKELLKNCDAYLQIAKSQLSEKELGLDGKEEL